MKRRGFLKRLGGYALGGLYALLPIGWLGKSPDQHITEMDIEKVDHVRLAKACSCRCKKDATSVGIKDFRHNQINNPPQPKPCSCGCGLSGGTAAVKKSMGA
jgi:hypothetical protein